MGLEKALFLEQWRSNRLLSKIQSRVLFLDEISDLVLAHQVKLLRAAENREFRTNTASKYNKLEML